MSCTVLVVYLLVQYANVVVVPPGLLCLATQCHPRTSLRSVRLVVECSAKILKSAYQGIFSHERAPRLLGARSVIWIPSLHDRPHARLTHLFIGAKYVRRD